MQSLPHYVIVQLVVCTEPSVANIIELDDGKIYRKALYLMVKTMVL